MLAYPVPVSDMYRIVSSKRPWALAAHAKKNKLWVGAYTEEPFELLSYHCVRAHPPLNCTASATTMKPLERMLALTPSVVLHRKPSLCMAS